MRQRAVRNQTQRGRITGKAAFLAAGLMLASACGSSTGTKPVDAAALETVCKDFGCFSVKKETKTRSVCEGDTLSVFKASDANVLLKVVKVDGKGVLLADSTEVLTSEHESDLWRVDYGEEKSIGEFILSFSVRAERGQEPRTARLTVTSISPPE